MKRKIDDITSPANLKEHSIGIGPARQQRPVYVDLLPPCNNACPAGENIQAWLALAQAEKFEEAWQVIMQDNPMPAVMGRVCYHPCEDGCNRTFIDSPVSIHALERFLGDEAIRKNWKVKFDKKPDGKRVLVVGAGPSGLSAAYHLTRLGHTVEIHEAGPMAGGMMHFGIPAYRLPRNMLDQEVERIKGMGVKIVLDHKVENVLEEKKAGSFDAAFIAVGAHLSKKIDIPGRDAGKILDAISFLKQVEQGEKPKIGRKVAIYGGGNTAMDAARTAKRMGASEATIIYRRDRKHMAAHEFEAEEALEEGIKINWLRTIKAMDEETFTVEVMRLEDGRPVPTGQFETLEADTLILAVGQDTDTGFLKTVPGIEFKEDGTVIVGPDMMTGCEGVFAGGDMVPSERSVTVAIGHGKKAARYIDGFLRGTPYQKPPKHPVVGYERLHLWYKTNATQKEQATLPAEKRVESFDEIKSGLSREEVLFESQRCLSCGNCFECDGCYGACPEEAIIKLGPGNRYRYDFDRCTGCAICYEQCPCHAIEMIPEPKNINL
ncbi:NAD(P)-binding protein [Yeosuana sp.]|uniref:NAD(P)-binding protein n=1 Tax=Yeosuana sp. TaxID=2529388 RepID=UPI004054EADA|tara:strand:- start:12303 stop:13946 length:1644 start_codon:yes stop_codon:yes gene_type:complete